MKAQADSSTRGQKDFVCRQEKRKAAWGHARALETGGQVGNWVFIAFFVYFPRVEMSLRCKQIFPGKKCLLGQLSPFGTFCSPSVSIMKDLPVCSYQAFHCMWLIPRLSTCPSFPWHYLTSITYNIVAAPCLLFLQLPWKELISPVAFTHNALVADSHGLPFSTYS
jgi:hypothetical protein